ncbi:KpsF/GutQ family sugar-phosphate isomerase [Vibrio alginolyticus]|jgi:arabinose-5-phosphate isomerase|uniref:KpsF/GutQ family sugar-phosphate isomerase n=1 Tax=Vibrio TaxID=662 RepID=UPI0014838447|nr:MULTISPECIES: KpsF/GutQ family sugar-phosphate isomerase [Vibrio]EGQ9571566.1 KpsF/GutQ family sugar-phosphate isomerase [Vibrio alginolyticus]EGR2355701.1 KpsF/GutQ family sugar-phosphate isomerase [Vibrio alginolyticus]EIL8372300.1 KpsF/GutQ family sugar-phosphate isomerase [Vibrio alginolyticus]ELA8259793.1 KpsF/GutQ family sugar-phosphate isomerase [Vibrio alginolyticus]ELB2928888.1 KpsF/GutQ family sugar-phosphate isomerase [Vibrio alginolyticus]
MKTLDINDYYSISGEQKPVLESIVDTFKHQANALNEMANSIDFEQYQKAISYIINCQGHVIVCGMGKSGHVGKKISATLASTGTPSFFLHPSEAFHGDLGMITKEDVIVLISNSGETDEVLQLIPSLKSFGNKIISITGRLDSTMSCNSDATLLLAQIQESCPNNLAPTTSTTLTIALGDALAVALMKMRQFMPNDFARFHPGGSLGRRLLTRVQDEMGTDNLPLVDVSDFMPSVIIKMNESRKGVAIVIENDQLKGIITDGDLRRALAKEAEFNILKAGDVMSREPKTCYDTEMLADAEEKMRQHSISSLVVLDDESKVVGLIQIFNM